jgi:hypothetical protein
MGAPLKLRAQAELSASSLDFGTVALSGSATRSVTVRNSGTADLVGTAALLTCPDYQLDSGGGPFTIGPGQQLTIVLRFVPSGTGSFPCTLDLGPNCGQVTLAGAGALQNPGAHCTVTPGALDFGNLPTGQSSFRIFQIFSDGTAPLLVNVVPTCAAYAVVSGGGPASLAEGTSLTVTVEFKPLAGGTSACAIAVGPGCADVSVTGDGTTVSYSTDVRTIFNDRTCLSCHGFVSPGLDGILYTYGNLVNVTSISGYAPALLVKPYDPTNSVLYGKITNSGQFGELMPQGGPQIPQAERDKIRTWILEGAHNN